MAADNFLTVDFDKRRGSQSSNYEVPHSEAQFADNHLDHLCLLDMFTQPHTLRNTGIICTIG